MSVQVIYDGTKVRSILEAGQLFIHITEIKEHSYDLRDLVVVLYDYKTDLSNLLMNENRLDLFDLYASLLYRTGTEAFGILSS